MRRLMLAGIPVVVGGLLPASAVALSVVAGRVAVCPTAVGLSSAGAVVLDVRSQSRGRWRAGLQSVDAVSGALSDGVGLSRGWRSPNRVRSVISGDGVEVAYEIGNPPIKAVSIRYAAAARAQHRRAVPQVWVAGVDGSGSVASQRVSDPSRAAGLHHVVSGGGATAVTYRQDVRGRLSLQEWVAVRPAGAKRFGRSVSLASPLHEEFSHDSVYLGPDGSGVIVSVPFEGGKSVSVRRITRQGVVGPAIAFGSHGSYLPFAAASVAGDGTVTVAVVDLIHAKDRHTSVLVATLAPGAGALTAPQVLGSEGYDGSNLAIASDSAGQVAIAVNQFSRDYTDQALQLFTTRAGQLMKGPRLPTVAASDPVLTPTADGAMALTWEGYLVGTNKIAQLASLSDPAGGWSPPSPISRPFTGLGGSNVTDHGVTALPGQGIAMAYSTKVGGHTSKCYLASITR